MKQAIITRGISGSGKSTLIKQVSKLAKKKDLSVAVHSTDNKFMVDGEYQFDITKLSHYHNENLFDFFVSVKEGVNIVICDNTNIQSWEYENYIKIAKEFGYTVKAVVFVSDSIGRHLERNTHGVPRDTIIQQKKKLNDNMKTVLVSSKNEWIVTPEHKNSFKKRMGLIVKYII